MSEKSHISVYLVDEVRIDRYLSEALTIPRSVIKTCIQSEAIRCNGDRVRPSQKVQHRDEIVVTLPSMVDALPVKSELKNGVIHSMDWRIPILHCDDHVLVICKPAGLVVHSAPTIADVNLVDIILAAGMSLVSGQKGRPGIVHRLDQFTEGVMVLAKSTVAFDHLTAQFRDRKIKKRYYAVLQGALSAKEGVIDRAIGRDASVRARQSCHHMVEGSEKDAVTTYKVLHALTNLTFVDVELLTGRTHQIRVHFASLNCPVLGDSLYSQQAKKLEGYYLQSYHLGFQHPVSLEWLNFSLPVSERLQKYAGQNNEK
jgi:23S rRNA pseudouridine1911/1915/1917 synthase